MGQIETFEEFLKRVLTILFWVLVIFPMIVFPLVGLVFAALKIPFDPFVLLTKPELIPQFMDSLGLGFDSVFFRVVVFPGFTTAALLATFMILWERKFLAKMQLRVGPQYAGRFEGILQPFADLFKLLFKELLVPAGADKPFFWAVPFASMAIAGALLSVIPLGPKTFIANIDVGLLVVFAIVGFFPMMALLAAWASNSKYPFIGGLRALHQMIAYEIPLILSALGVVMLSRSLNFIEIVNGQSNYWYVFVLPLGAFVFFVGVLAELERIPFDLPDADTEIVAGWLTEYSGMAFGVVQLAIYIKFYALAAIFTLLFLGGWHGPMIFPLGLEEVNANFWFLLKTVLVMTAMMIPRGANPRIRIDIMLRAGWAKLLVLSFINIFMALILASLTI